MAMRITKTDEPVHQYVRRLKSDGWKELGQGHFSTVLHKKGMPNVMRINTGEDYDAGWEEFIRHLRKSPAKDNPHFARYGEVKKYGFVPKGSKEIERYMVGEVERLHTADRCDYDNSSRIIDHIINQVENVRMGYGKKMTYIPYIPKTLYEAVEFLMDVKEKSKSNLRFDVHECNIMSRANGDLVITDPFSYDIYSLYY
jgi:hypothetical protein